MPDPVMSRNSRGSIATMPQTALELLRLLADDAPAEQLEEQARRLAAGDVEMGAAARDLALRVRAVMDARRRREAELTALVEVARDLASLRDSGGVLDAIVRRARTLVRTDVAYLTLFDPDAGDTIMRATAGSVSARFQNLRLPLGAGLGGLVAQTRHPYWTADYPEDERFRHTGEIDDAVGDEGLVAICGVPLLVEDEFVGVLFASNRTRRPFSVDEVSLLGSLAALAAVSLVQSRHAAEQAAALDELSRVHATVRTHTAGIEKAAAAHDRFAAVVLEGGGLADVTAALVDTLGGWVVVLDGDGRRAASHGGAPAPAPRRDDLLDAASVEESKRTGRLASAEGLHAVVAHASGEHLGTLVLGGRDGLDDGEQRIVERAAVVAALVLLFARQTAEAQQRVRTDLLSDVLSHRGSGPQAQAIAARGRGLGLSLDEPHVLAVCRGALESRRGLALTASTIVSGRGLAGEHHGDVVVLVPASGTSDGDGTSGGDGTGAGDDPGEVAALLSRRLGRGVEGGVTVGASGPVVPTAGVGAAHAEARRTVEALLALGTPGRGAAAEELGFAGLVVSGMPDVGRYVGTHLGPVLDYDERRGTDLVRTLDAYFGAGTSPRRAADTLHVHVNTIAQRLDRVRALLGDDWQEPDRTLELQLALRLRRLISG